MQIFGIVFAVVLTVLLLAGLYEWAEHALPKRQCYTIEGQSVSLRLLLLSDLHCSPFLLNRKSFLKKILAEQADVVCIAGDFINKHGGRRNFSVLPFLKQLTLVAPVYYSYGNHESLWRENVPEEFAEYERQVVKAGVHFLDNTSACFEKDGKKVCITGLTLPLEAYQRGKRKKLPKEAFTCALDGMPQADYNILLAHTPDYGRDYAALPVQLICSGHLHGGLIRLPFLGGLLSPQFVRPLYTKGVYRLDSAILLVSAGLGSHTLFVRVFNRVEYSLTELLR